MSPVAHTSELDLFQQPPGGDRRDSYYYFSGSVFHKMGGASPLVSNLCSLCLRLLINFQTGISTNHQHDSCDAVVDDWLRASRDRITWHEAAVKGCPDNYMYRADCISRPTDT